jgi:hypothetical protein
MAVSRPPVYQEYYTRTPWQLFSGAVRKRLVAFRADEHGVTVGGPVARYRRFTVTLPWRDVETVTLWATKWPRDKPERHIGLKLRPGVPDIPGPNAKLTRHSAAQTAPHLEYDVVRNSRPIFHWNPDPTQLGAALQTFAPGVRLCVPPVHEKSVSGGSVIPGGSGASVFDVTDLF